MTHHNPLSIPGMKMHCSTETILEHFAIGTLTSLHPLAVAERLETVFPDIEKVVLIDIALSKAAIDIRTSGNRTNRGPCARRDQRRPRN